MKPRGRRWIVRGMVFALLAAGAVAAVLSARSPEAPPPFRIWILDSDPTGRPYLLPGREPLVAWKVTADGFMDAQIEREPTSTDRLLGSLGMDRAPPASPWRYRYVERAVKTTPAGTWHGLLISAGPWPSELRPDPKVAGEWSVRTPRGVFQRRLVLKDDGTCDGRPVDVEARRWAMAGDLILFGTEPGKDGASEIRLAAIPDAEEGTWRLAGGEGLRRPR